MSNPYIFTEAYPNDPNDLIDYNPEEAYELGVSAGIDSIKSTHEHKFVSASISGAPQCECGKVYES